MPIPPGTTSRQLGALTRWALAAVVASGVFTWSRPSLAGWGAMAGATLVVFFLWLLWKTLRADTAVPGSLVHLALLGPAAICVAHFIRHALLVEWENSGRLGGGLDVSAVYQVGLLCLWVMLSQSLMAADSPTGHVPGRKAVILVCAGAMMAGAAFAVATDRHGPLVPSMTCLAMGGAGLWLSAVWPRKAQRYSADTAETDHGIVLSSGAPERCSTNLALTAHGDVPSSGAPEGQEDLAGGAAPGKRPPETQSPEGAKESMDAAVAKAGSLRPSGADSHVRLSPGAAPPAKSSAPHSGRKPPIGRRATIANIRWASFGGALLVPAAVWVGALVFEPSAAKLAAGALFTMAVLAWGIWLGKRYLYLSLLGLSLLVVVLVFLVVRDVPGLASAFAAFSRQNPLGVGEDFLLRFGGADSGLAVLLSAVGWAGTAWAAIFFILWGVVLLVRERRAAHALRSDTQSRGGEMVPVVLRLWASAMLAAALLAPGGLFVPCLSASAGLTWGIAAGAGKALPRRQPGMVLVASLAAVMFVLGLAPVAGVAAWSSVAFDLPDPFLHVTVGFFLVMALVWLMGKGRTWRRFLAVAIAIAAGGAAELAQQFASRRGGEWSDWFWHCVGCAGGTAIYLLAAGAKGCEHPDAPAPAARSDVAQYPTTDDE